MRILLSALCALVTLQAQANYDVQKIQRKVTIQSDINVEIPQGGMLDILFVMDDSASMTYFERSFSKASSVIEQELKKTKRDFHLGVITGDSEDISYLRKAGELQGSPTFITRRDLTEALPKNLWMGGRGTSVQTPFDAIKLALSEPILSGTNKGFLRGAAPLAIVLLTDGEDQSQLTGPELQSFLGNLKGDSSLITMFSWVIPSALTNPSCPRDWSGLTPQRIEDLTQKLSGTIYNLCNIDATSMADLSQRLAQFAKSATPAAPVADIAEVPLYGEPVVSSIVVKYGTQILPAGDANSGWIYDSAKKSILLADQIAWSTQPAGTKLEISFDVVE